SRFIAICTVSAVGIVAFAFAFVPQVATLATSTHAEAQPLNLDPLAQRSLIYDRDGHLVGPLPSIENRSPVTLAQIPTLVKRAILAVEDNNFYSHSGVDLKATVRALFTNVQSGSVEQ